MCITCIKVNDGRLGYLEFDQAEILAGCIIYSKSGYLPRYYADTMHISVQITYIIMIFQIMPVCPVSGILKVNLIKLKISEHILTWNAHFVL